MRDPSPGEKAIQLLKSGVDPRLSSDMRLEMRSWASGFLAKGLAANVEQEIQGQYEVMRTADPLTAEGQAAVLRAQGRISGMQRVFEILFEVSQ